jgi:hypothetical protein
MPCLFKAIGNDRGFPSGYAERISGLIPGTIQKHPCFLDRLTGIWRYEYGKPITLQAGGTIVGTPMFPEVERLFDVLGCSEWRLRTEKLQAYLARLADPARHEDVLVEFAPILRLPDGVAVQHEVSANEDGTGTVDWSIEAPGFGRFGHSYIGRKRRSARLLPLSPSPNRCRRLRVAVRT